MILYLGGLTQARTTLDMHGKWEDFNPKHFLATFFYQDQIKFVENNWKEMDRIFIDCGAFSFWNSKHKGDPNYYKTQSHKDYMKRYASWLHKKVPDDPKGRSWKEVVTSYANLDVLGNAEATWESQKEMEKLGLDPMPVYHYTDTTVKFLKKYIEQYDTLATGGAINIGSTEMTFPQRDAVMTQVFDLIEEIKGRDEEGHLKVRTHAFGITGLPFHKRFEYHSADSVSWAMAAGYGSVPFLLESKLSDGTPEAKQKSLKLTDRTTVDLKSLNGLKDGEWQLLLKKIESHGFDLEQVKKHWSVRRILGMEYYHDLERWITAFHDHFRHKRKNPKPLF
jgi:hypothetical protein